jgi:hypothetical protein
MTSADVKVFHHSPLDSEIKPNVLSSTKAFLNFHLPSHSLEKNSPRTTPHPIFLNITVLLIIILFLEVAIQSLT